ncbi:hypothetical protein M8J75_004461 [Diaphorina citri]|nr:hypothetical protein M8J75_004461 [Diaphorina citri]
MGLLTEGSPLSWEKTQELADHVEYIIVKFDHQNKKARVSLKAEELLNILNEKEHRDPEGVKSLWRPEYGAYMIEGTPGKPYGGLPAHLNIVEANMRYRREEAQELLAEDEVLFSITNFPRLGCPGFTFPPAVPTPTAGASQSLFLPEEMIFPGHPRFATLTRNIRLRRGEKVAINIPIYKDVNTPQPFIEDLSQYGDQDKVSQQASLPDHVYLDAMVDFYKDVNTPQPFIEDLSQYGDQDKVSQQASLPDHVYLDAMVDFYKDVNTPQPFIEDLSQYGDQDKVSQQASLPDHVYLDAMGFGMGCCCLQLALTAASPIFRGYLTDVDCRWNVISGSVDCRTREERGLEPLRKNRFVIPKSRYDSIDSYLSPEHGEKYNDVPLIYDRDIYNQLIQNGIDPMLSQHIAHLFIRDTNIQSTNWQTMRFKPPPPNSSIGWRVEFRPCETQLTDFENAAFVCFVVLLTRIVLSYNLNFVIPISKVDENMKRAQKRDALNREKFWFRRDCAIKKTGGEDSSIPGDSQQLGPPMDDTPETNPLYMNGNSVYSGSDEAKYNGATNNNNNENIKQDGGEEYVEMTINEIINGKEGVFPGLAPLISRYLISMDVDTDTHCTIQQYLKLIQNRASGEILTTASWIRSFVTSHPAYKQDSVVSEEITYDLLLKSHHIQTGRTPCPQLLGKCLIQKSKTRERIPTAVSKQYNCLER